MRVDSSDYIVMSKVQIPVPVSQETERLARQLKAHDWTKHPVLTIPPPMRSFNEKLWYDKLANIFSINVRRIPVMNSKSFVTEWEIREDPCNGYVPPADWD